MPTFESSKKVSEIQEAKLLPEDWYLTRIVKDPKEVPNNARKKGSEVVDGGGINWQITMRVQHDNPDYHGRPLLVSLPVPCEDKDEDGKVIEETMINQVSGRTVYDEKYERLAQWCAAFAGFDFDSMGDETSLELSQGSEAMIYVNQGPDFRDPNKITNSIDIFNSVPMKAE